MLTASRTSSAGDDPQEGNRPRSCGEATRLREENKVRVHELRDGGFEREVLHNRLGFSHARNQPPCARAGFGYALATDRAGDRDSGLRSQRPETAVGDGDLLEADDLGALELAEAKGAYPFVAKHDIARGLEALSYAEGRGEKRPAPGIETSGVNSRWLHTPVSSLRRLARIGSRATSSALEHPGAVAVEDLAAVENSQLEQRCGSLVVTPAVSGAQRPEEISLEAQLRAAPGASATRASAIGSSASMRGPDTKGSRMSSLTNSTSIWRGTAGPAVANTGVCAQHSSAT